MSITRRDFLNKTALTIAAGLTPAQQLAAQPAFYPPALTGMRGHHEGLLRDRPCARPRGQGSFRSIVCRSDESYDLVVVGGGISGLAAAWYYRRAKPQARILVLDNHDDFGGHAKRNEFTLERTEFHRLWRFGIDPVAACALQSCRQEVSARPWRRIPSGSIQRSIAISMRRWVLHAAPSLPAEAFGRDALVRGDRA